MNAVERKEFVAWVRRCAGGYSFELVSCEAGRMSGANGSELVWLLVCRYPEGYLFNPRVVIPAGEDPCGIVAKARVNLELAIHVKK